MNLRALLRIGLPLALACLPFELAAGVGLGPLTLTSVELLILLPLAAWAALLVAERRRPLAPAWLVGGAAALVGLLLLGALFAVEQRAGALKFSLRQACGAALALCVADTLSRREHALRPLTLGGALVAGATLSAALGLWEMGESALALAALAPFKTEGSYMGGLLRLSGTLGYTNTAAMYYEALLPLSALLAAHSWRAPRLGAPRSWLRPIACCLAPATLLLGTLLTYSRAALAVSGLLLLLTPALAWLRMGRPAGRASAVACAALAALGLATAALLPSVRLRLSEPDVARWYGAAYRPGPLPTLAPNQLTSVAVALENRGQIAWEPAGSRPVRLAYHWLDAESGAVVRFEGRRTELPRRVGPGETITVTATLQAPQRPGRYLLAWDMLREYIGRGWFSEMGIAPAEVEVVVAGRPAPRVAAPAADPPSAPRELAVVPGPPGRSDLWRVALALWAERPLLGIGPDVFRHVYGPRLGLEPFDDRVHTNNLYLELLLGAGPAALLAFLGLLGAALLAGWRALGQPTRQGDWALLGALLGLLAFLGHGLLDVFLAFTPTYALLWALLGAVAGLAGRAGR